MNRRLVLHTTGYILIAEAVLMLLPMVVSLGYGDGSFTAFLFPALACAATGFLFQKIKLSKRTVFAREGFVIVALSYIFLSLFGCLPFILSGYIPKFIDAFFETVSGFTTTGATVLSNIEACSKSILFWRSFTQWLGGMGVLVFLMVIIPLGGDHSIHLIRAEQPGPTKGKLAPRMRDTAQILYTIYIILTLLEIILLGAGGMNLYDSAITAFSSAGTGGFSNYNNSIAHFNSPYFEYVISIFLLLFGMNFNLFYLLLIRRARQVFKDEELRFYLIIVAVSVITMTLNLRANYEDYGESFRVALFQVSSTISTAGFVSTDFMNWPEYSRTLLVILMLVGACTGSTAGGIKISRIIIWIRTYKRGISRMLHPRSVTRVHFDGRALDAPTLEYASLFLVCYAMIAALSVLLLSLDNLDFETGLAATISCFNNSGATTEVMSTNYDYADYSFFSKLVLCFDMFAGRLEIFPMLILFSRPMWTLRRGR